ncbi:MAG: helix-hairpin-helix domain-containing protein [Oscillospiraceae bacterium]|nr:helix-hairpin-helix domain-containing protein [Oscillospiraceae bacterium]
MRDGKQLKLGKSPELLVISVGLLIAAVVLFACAAAKPKPIVLKETLGSPVAQSAQTQAVVFETAASIVEASENPSVSDTTPQNLPQAANENASPQVSAAPSYPVNLNTATLEQLETLPGIGPVKAEAILAYRAQRGAFSSVEQLLDINGIGEKTLEKLKPLITLY